MRDFHQSGRSVTIAANAMCATSHPLAAQTAIAVLQDGGNAVDAAVAAAVLLGFCEPQMTGLGGDMFALIKPADGGDVIGLNASGRAPAALNAADLRAQGLTTLKGDVAAVTVPGAVDGFCRLIADHGALPLAKVLAPAIRYAETGVPVAPRVAADWAEAVGRLSGRATDYFTDAGTPLPMGAMFRAEKQAEVLRLIAQHGRDGFYTGAVARDMVDSLTALGGVHTMEDFAETRAEYVSPISAPYRGATLTELPPNGQGVTAILLTQILAQFDLASMDPNGAQRAHLEIEATKLAYDARNRFIGDADTTTRADHMTAPETAKALAALIDPDRAMEDPTLLSEQVHKDTVYLTVVDADGMAVSMIYSIFSTFGSGLASDEYGILFHDRGAGFTLTPGHPNEAAGGKRPMHTIIPAMLTMPSGDVMPFGVMGGPYQACGHARFVSNIIDFGMTPQAAIDGPRCFPDPELGGVRIERSYSAELKAELEAKGHKLVDLPLPIGGAQAILIDRARGILIGGSDPRKDGLALGY